MTYILGWKFGPSAYIIADTALTLTKPTRDETERAAADRTTSFGELNVLETERVVGEGALKLINLDRLAVAYCGDVRVARSVVETLASDLRAGAPPRESFQRALRSNAPFDPNKQIHLIASIPDSPEPILLAFNIDGDQKIHEISDETLIQFGSVPKMHKGLSAEFLKRLSVFKAEPDRLLASALAIIQSYGIHDYLLQEGVGGSFVGLRVDSNGIQWQQDLIFILKADLDPKFDIVSSIVRDNVLIVRSTFTNRCSYFGDSSNEGLNHEWRRQWWDAAFEFTARGHFDFVVLLNTAARIVTVVEMQKRNQSEHFRIFATDGETPGETRWEADFSPDLMRAAVERLQEREDGSIPFKFNWFPFSPAQ